MPPSWGGTNPGSQRSVDLLLLAALTQFPLCPVDGSPCKGSALAIAFIECVQHFQRSLEMADQFYPFSMLTRGDRRTSRDTRRLRAQTDNVRVERLHSGLTGTRC